MKKSRLVYLSLGFIAGISYLIACGGGSSKVEEAIGQAASSVITALSVTYDNATSKLQATTVQAAVDELAAKPTGGNTISTTQLVGTWTGDKYYTGGTISSSLNSVVSNISIVFNANGTMSCSNGGFSRGAFSTNEPYCTSSENITWKLLGNTIVITNSSIADDNSYRRYMFKINFLDSSNIALYSTGDTTFFYGTKQ